ncbi:unnamed protein product [Microthlaspi erraticum]|uniref:Vps53 N-terminal domain-containing protein n=1 Tax=Microthlaspi erraticum TaxID=1685480 RepID=A0A6D2KK84_9BRAS|nr:unnamed protein product [Microthlaspi erraticum]
MDKSSGLEFLPAEAYLRGVEPLMQNFHSETRRFDDTIVAAIRRQELSHKLHSEIRRVDATILAAIRQQRYSGSKAKDDLAGATRSAEELSHTVQEIKSKADKVKAMVQETCCDINKLDFAIKNITMVITPLQRLTVVVSAVAQLQVMASERQYKKAASLLEAVNQLCNHIEANMDLPNIKEVREKIKNIKQFLKSQVFYDFSSLGTVAKAEETNLLEMLSDSCLVVDALDPSVREELELERTLKFEKELENKLGKGEHNRHNVSEIRMEHVEKSASNQESKENINFRGIISSCFEPYLTPYIEGEENELMRCLENFVQVFQRVLKAYAAKLIFKLSKEGTRKQIIKVSEIDEKVICYIVRSAEFCHKTSGDLAEEVSTIIDPHYAESVDMSEVQDDFSSVITKGLLTLVRRMETKFDTEMAATKLVPWGTPESVGDHSNYVNGINTILNKSIPVVGEILSPVYFQFFMEKLASSLGLRFYANIFRCRQISETSAQQMLLDTQAMEMILLNVPFLDKQSASGASYSEFVKHQMNRAVAVLKVLLSPIDSVADTYSKLFPNGTAMDLEGILELKGLKKADEQSIADDGPKTTQPSVAAIEFIANREDVLARAATSGYIKFIDRPLRKLFKA